MNYPETTQMKPVNNYSSLIRPLKRPLNRRPAQAAQKPNSPRRVQNGDRLHINPQVKSIDTLRAAFKEYNYRAIQAHSSELLLKLALEDSRFALHAHKELLRRKDYNTVSTIANHYCDIKTKDIFDGILSDWLDGPTTDSRFLEVANNLFFGEKIKNLFGTLAGQKELRTIAKILNLYEVYSTENYQYGLLISNFFMKSCGEHLDDDKIKKLANILECPSVINCFINCRNLTQYLHQLKCSETDLATLKARDQPKILLIGGGQSSIKKDLGDKNHNNIHVTNVDPIRYSNPEDTADLTINEDLLTANIEGKFDEIWCLFSLPLYIVNPDDVTKFYTKALGLLADNGVLRIFPAVLKDIDSRSVKEKLLKPLVHKESQKVIDDLKTNPNYEVDNNKDSNTVTIRKKPQTT